MTSTAARLRRLEDTIAIEETMYRYLSAWDRGDDVTIGEQFSTGAVELWYGPLGEIDSLDTLLQIRADMTPTGGQTPESGMLTMHHAVGPHIEFINDDQARATWSLRYRHVTVADRSELILAGTYDNMFVRENGRWLIRRLHFDALWMTDRPLPDHTHLSLGPLMGTTTQPVPAAPSNDIETRLARLEARHHIEELKYRYWRACDAKDVEVFRSCFVTQGAELDYGTLGVFATVDDLVETYQRIACARDDDGRLAIVDMHHGMHPQITMLSDTEAVGRWALRFRQVHTPSNTERVLCGEYDDRYVFEDGHWRLQRHNFTVLWSMERPCSTITEGPLLRDVSAPPMT